MFEGAREVRRGGKIEVGGVAKMVMVVYILRVAMEYVRAAPLLFTDD